MFLCEVPYDSPIKELLLVLRYLVCAGQLKTNLEQM